MGLEAKKTQRSEWKDLLPVAAQVNLQCAMTLDKIKGFIPHSEVAINLSQNVLRQEHFGSVAPVLLASTSLLWGVIRGRPYTSTVSWRRTVDASTVDRGVPFFGTVFGDEG